MYITVYILILFMLLINILNLIKHKFQQKCDFENFIIKKK